MIWSICATILIFVCFSGYPTDLYEADITGIAEALKNLTEAGAIDPQVKINVHLSESGFVTVTDAVVHGEIKDESLTGQEPFISLFNTKLTRGRQTEVSIWRRFLDEHGSGRRADGICGF